MITAEIAHFIEGISRAMVASADISGNPHLALGSEITVLDGQHMELENWYCRTTLKNLEQNPRIAIAAMSRDAEIGYQFIGEVAHGYDVAILDGYVPGREQPNELQTLTRIVVRVDKILAFCSGLHNDLPVSN